MRKPGAVSSYTEDRKRELLRAYQLAILNSTGSSFLDYIERAINTPCSRFWVSSERAVSVVVSVLNGKPLGYKGIKAEMFREILHRYHAMRKAHPDWSNKEIVTVVVHQPAPKFYLTAGTAIVYISQMKKEWRKRLRR